MSDVNKTSELLLEDIIILMTDGVKQKRPLTAAQFDASHWYWKSGLFLMQDTLKGQQKIIFSIGLPKS